MHNILFDAYAAYLIACGLRGARDLVHVRGGGVAGRGAATLLALGDAAAAADDGVEPGENDGEPEEAEPDVQPAPSAEDVGGDPAAAPDWQALNAKFRQQGFFFIRQQPLAAVLLLRLCIEPFRSFFASHILLTSEEWEVRQRVADAGYLRGGPGSRSREYRAVVAAEGKLEISFFGSVRDHGTDARPWRRILGRSFVVAFRALAFKILSRMGCAVHQMRRVPHMQFPVEAFFLLSDDTFAEVFAEAKDCELDSFSKAFS